WFGAPATAERHARSLHEALRSLCQVRHLLGLLLQVAQQMQGADPLAHPAFEERLGGAPQVEIRVQLAAEAFDVEQGLLQQHQLRSEEHTSELQSRENLVCRLLL